MRALAWVILSALCGCSLLFDPAKAPPKGCPATPSGCPKVPNAVASCSDAICKYSCATNFIDANGDLDMAGSNGCELDCTTGQPPANPPSLVAVVGAAAGQVDWSFPASSSAPAKYKLCVAPPGGSEVCTNIDPLAQCTGGSCTQSTTGHADNVRVTGRLVSVDTCGREGSATSAPQTSTTPFDTSDLSKWTHDSSCANSSYDVVGGQLSLEQMNDTCSATLVAGDDQWSDYTLEGDLKFGVAGGKITGGLAAPVAGTGYRMGALAAAENPMNAVFLALSRRLPSDNDKVMATSIHGVTGTGTAHLRFVSHQHLVSVSIGPTADTMAEVIRFPDPYRQPGKLGIAALGTGRLEVTHFRVSTASELPPLGPKSVTVDFDGGAPVESKSSGPNLSYGPCPAWPAAASCDGGCLPASGSGCAHLTQPWYGGTALAFDLPVGIDVAAPWSLSMKLALTPDAGALYPQLIQGQPGALLGNGATGWGATAQGLTVDYGVVLTEGTWHDALWRFDPDAGSFDLAIDDTRVNLASHAFPPNGNWSPHLGALSVGGGLTNDAYVTDLRVSQP